MARPPARTLLTLGLLALLVLPGPARAETVQDALKRQDALRTLVERWIRLAERDPREDRVDAYAAYQEEDFKKRDRDSVRAAELALLVGDATRTTDKTLRQRAAKVLEEAAIKSRDPDLAPDKRNDTKRRRQWAKQHLLPLIARPNDQGGDDLGRQLAFELLQTWFQVPARDQSDVANYDPKSAKEKTWAPAAKVFREVLNK